MAKWRALPVDENDEELHFPQHGLKVSDKYTFGPLIHKIWSKNDCEKEWPTLEGNILEILRKQQQVKLDSFDFA